MLALRVIGDGHLWKVGEAVLMNWKEHKNNLMKNPEFVKEYNSLEPEYKLAADLIRLFLARGLTQEDLAKLLNAKQESIARLENGGLTPSLSTMKKLAEALDAELEIIFRPRHAN
jgi:DNA-binding XRE family transcriptional regulator